MDRLIDVPPRAAALLDRSPLYPLRFAPIFQERIWGGRRLADWFDAPLPGLGPIGEAWLLSDRDDHPSKVSDGPLKGLAMSQLMLDYAVPMLGSMSGRFTRFPLLLKFLDVHAMLSVQVHPSDGDADLLPAGETGKTEAWVVLEADPKSRLYVGLKPGVRAADLRELSDQTVDGCLGSFAPQRGQGVLIEAGTVHATGDGVLVFEVQENSDVTFRLYDWGHIDPETGHPRPLQVEQALACIDLTQGTIRPVAPILETTLPVRRELLFDDRHFRLWRLQGADPFSVGAADEPRVLVSIGGHGMIDHEGTGFALERGTVMLLPAVVGACRFRPDGPVTLLEIAIPGPA